MEKTTTTATTTVMVLEMTGSRTRLMRMTKTGVTQLILSSRNYTPELMPILVGR